MISAEFASAHRSAHSVLPTAVHPVRTWSIRPGLAAARSRPVPRLPCRAPPCRARAPSRRRAPCRPRRTARRPSSRPPEAPRRPRWPSRSIDRPSPSAIGSRPPPRWPAGATSSAERPSVWTRISANSSPPMRATRSTLRTVPAIRRATSLRTTSPAGCPWVSLTDLNRSMSMITSPSGWPKRRARSSSSARIRSYSRRLSEARELVPRGQPAQRLEGVAELERVAQRPFERARGDLALHQVVEGARPPSPGCPRSRTTRPSGRRSGCGTRSRRPRGSAAGRPSRPGGSRAGTPRSRPS